MAKLFKNYDVIMTPAFDGDCNQLTNLTGYPCVVVPDGFANGNHPTSVCFIGNLFGEAKMLAVAKIYQDATGFQLKHPDLTKLDSPGTAE